MSPSSDNGPSSPSVAIGAKVTLLLTSTLTIMAGATISPALPAIADHFAGTPYAALLSRLLLTLPGLFVAIAALFGGKIVDRFSRTRLLLFSTLLFGFAGASGLVANSLPTLLLGRALLGFAVAGIMTCGAALVGDLLSPSARAPFIGYQMAFSGVGGIIFLIGGGALAELGWRGPFWIYLLAFLIAPLIWIYLEGASKIARRDIATAQINWSPTGPEIVLCLTAAATSILFYLMPTQLPFLLREKGMATPILAGAAIAALSFAQAVSAALSARLRVSLVLGSTFLLGFSALGAGLLVASLGKTMAEEFAGAVLAGVGVGILTPTLVASMLALATEHVRGRATAAMTGSIFFGQFLSPFVSQPEVNAFGLAPAFLINGAVAGAVGIGAKLYWRRLQS